MYSGLKWAYEIAPQDIRQIHDICDWQYPDKSARLRAINLEIERLLRDLGFRKIKAEDGTRKWVSEFHWLKLGRRGVGAPRGNKNAAGHVGKNQYTN